MQQQRNVHESSRGSLAMEQESPSGNQPMQHYYSELSQQLLLLVARLDSDIREMGAHTPLEFMGMEIHIQSTFAHLKTLMHFSVTSSNPSHSEQEPELDVRYRQMEMPFE